MKRINKIKDWIRVEIGLLGLFLRIVWRPVAGDPGDSWFSAWRKYRLSIGTAWGVCRAIESPRNRENVREVMAILGQ